jgi:hypothetical protein
MIIIDDILISDAIIKEFFACQVAACKGACCWEGDEGAPLEENETTIIKEQLNAIKPFLDPEGLEAIEEAGPFIRSNNKRINTPLLKSGACAYMLLEEGVAQCGIEKAYNAGVTDFRKPISCHLYPVRVTEDQELDFEALNYEIWDICSAACSNGKKTKVRLFEFVKDALIRKYGEEFYERLQNIASNQTV